MDPNYDAAKEYAPGWCHVCMCPILNIYMDINNYLVASSCNTITADGAEMGAISEDTEGC